MTAAAHVNSAAKTEDAVHPIIKSAAIALTLVGIGTLISHRADAGPALDHALRAAIASLNPVDAIACRRGDRRNGHHCFIPRTDNQASRLDEAGQPDSRRRFSRG
jgi:hypothetical protein